MTAVNFEVAIAPGCQRAYLNLAGPLRPVPAEVDGFLSIERFQRLVEADELLSPSFSRDEAAVDRWRNVQAHRVAQFAGREPASCRRPAARGTGLARPWHARSRAGSARISGRRLIAGAAVRRARRLRTSIRQKMVGSGHASDSLAAAPPTGPNGRCELPTHETTRQPPPDTPPWGCSRRCSWR
ncbi:MAG: antibiotic biosynthesis monooxygenase [Rhodocyclaceae bacterium]|nr:antibiotic biosynthesis monooxygenase [Rhodocyclaceae bacterium]